MKKWAVRAFVQTQKADFFSCPFTRPEPMKIKTISGQTKNVC